MAYHQEIRVKFVYEGHRVKVKVTRAKEVDNPRWSTGVGGVATRLLKQPYRAAAEACDSCN